MAKRYQAKTKRAEAAISVSDKVECKVIALLWQDKIKVIWWKKKISLHYIAQKLNIQTKHF